ncbi:MAG TPA: hypothetical protein PK156_34580 [Polyangium sp.]|nr:hypothetical protein [Polyangium sp.]
MTNLSHPNGVRFDPAAGRDHVESYFLKANEPSGDRAIWIKSTIYASAKEPDRPVAEGWAIAFDRRGGTNRHVAVKHVLPFSSASFDRERLDVHWSIPSSRADEPQQQMNLQAGKTSGRIVHRKDSIAWNLNLEGEARALVPYPYEAMYSGGFPKSKTLTPYPDLRLSGDILVNGERWDISGWPGMQGHNWGRGHADLYAWCHVNSWESEAELIVEAISGRVRVGPVLTPVLTVVCARFRGVDYLWNGPIEMARAHGDIGLRRYSFTVEAQRARMEGLFEVDADDMVGLYYPNPDGPMTYCLNSKLARAHVRLEIRGRPPVSVNSRAAALEIGTRDADHGVRMYV